MAAIQSSPSTGFSGNYYNTAGQMVVVGRLLVMRQADRNNRSSSDGCIFLGGPMRLSTLLIVLILSTQYACADQPQTPPGIRTLFPADPQRKLTVPQVQRILARKVDLQFQRTPLDEALTRIGRENGLPVSVDFTSLDEEGIAADETLDVNLKNVALGPALQLVLGQFGLVADRVAGGLLVTTKYASWDTTDSRSHPIGKLLEAGLTPMGLRTLIEEFELGGPKYADLPPDQVVLQNGLLTAKLLRPGHRQLEELLPKLQLALETGRCLASDPPERKLQDRLRKPVTMVVPDWSVKKLADWITDRWGIPVFIDRRDLENEGISLDRMTTGGHFFEVRLGTVLQEVLAPLGLHIHSTDGILLITTGFSTMDWMSFAVFDLRRQHGLGWLGPEQSLDLVLGYTDASWDDAPYNQIRYCDGLLVVRQTQAAIQEIDELLRRLREAKLRQKPETTVWLTPTDQPSRRLRPLLKQLVRFTGGPNCLPQFLDLLRQRKITVTTDQPGSTHHQIDPQKLSVPLLQNISIAEALDRVLTPHSLGWRVESGILKISTREETEWLWNRTVAVFTVGDLLSSGMKPETLMTGIYRDPATGPWKPAWPGHQPGYHDEMQIVDGLLVVWLHQPGLRAVARRLQILRAD